MNISQVSKKYYQKIYSLDLELIIASALKKSREFVLAHPEFQLTKTQETSFQKMIKRRLNNEPMAYILGQKEFYGLNFKVTPDTLIPRPETELLVELALNKMQQETRGKRQETRNKRQETGNKRQETRDKKQGVIIVDVGTGSGNIIISIAKNLLDNNCHSRENGNPVSTLLDSSRSLSAEISDENDNYKLFGLDISRKALAIAKHNAKQNKVKKKIKFLHGNLLEPILKNCSMINDQCSMIILANLPYLSKKIYDATMPDVKNFEPISALYSKNHGLHHYEKLLSQTVSLKKTCHLSLVTCLLEFSPEQKNSLNKIIKKYFPKAKITFHKDLARKWRIAEISIK